MKKTVLKKTILITNISHVYPEFPTKNELRIAIGALSLTNQKSNLSDDCNPMLAGWNENPAVGFADFQMWIKCRIEESFFIVGDKIIPFAENLSLHPKMLHGELCVILEFNDGTRFKIAVRDESKPIEVCEWGKGPNFLKNKIKEYGYTDLSGE